jgi:hypothetical protein
MGRHSQETCGLGRKGLEEAMTKGTLLLVALVILLEWLF